MKLTKRGEGGGGVEATSGLRGALEPKGSKPTEVATTENLIETQNISLPDKMKLRRNRHCLLRSRKAKEF